MGEIMEVKHCVAESLIQPARQSIEELQDRIQARIDLELILTCKIKQTVK